MRTAAPAESESRSGAWQLTTWLFAGLPSNFPANSTSPRTRPAIETRGVVNRLPRAARHAPSAKDDLPRDNRSLAGPLQFVQERRRGKSSDVKVKSAAWAARRQDAAGGLDVDLAGAVVRIGASAVQQRSASRSVTCERLMRSGSSAAGACVKRIMGPGPRYNEFTISIATAPGACDSTPTPTRRKTQFFRRMRPDGSATAAVRRPEACCQTMAAINSGLPPAD